MTRLLVILLLTCLPSAAGTAIGPTGAGYALRYKARVVDASGTLSQEELGNLHAFLRRAGAVINLDTDVVDMFTLRSSQNASSGSNVVGLLRYATTWTGSGTPPYATYTTSGLQFGSSSATGWLSSVSGVTFPAIPFTVLVVKISGGFSNQLQEDNVCEITSTTTKRRVGMTIDGNMRLTGAFDGFPGTGSSNISTRSSATTQGLWEGGPYFIGYAQTGEQAGTHYRNGTSVTMLAGGTAWSSLASGADFRFYNMSGNRASNVVAFVAVLKGDQSANFATLRTIYKETIGKGLNLP